MLYHLKSKSVFLPADLNSSLVPWIHPQTDLNPVDIKAINSAINLLSKPKPIFRSLADNANGVLISSLFLLNFCLHSTEISGAGITTFNTEKWLSMLSRRCGQQNTNSANSPYSLMLQSVTMWFNYSALVYFIQEHATFTRIPAIYNYKVHYFILQKFHRSKKKI